MRSSGNVVCYPENHTNDLLLYSHAALFSGIFSLCALTENGKGTKFLCVN